MSGPSERDGRRVGLAVLLLGSALFSCKAILIKLAYRHEVSSIALLALRMAAALPIFLAVGWYRSRGVDLDYRPTRRDYALLALAGLSGYYLASYTDFLGLRYVSAGMERVILYAYPTLVLLLQWALFGERIRPAQAWAVLLCYVGVGVAFADADWSPASDFPLGAGLVLLSALLYAGYVVASGRLAPKLGTVRFTTIALVTAGVAVIAHAVASGERLVGLAPEVYALGAAMGVFCTAIPAYLVTEGIRRIGAGDAAIVGSVGPAVTIALEYLVLREALTWIQALGALLIVAGVVVIGRSKAAAPTPPADPATAAPVAAARTPR